MNKFNSLCSIGLMTPLIGLSGCNPEARGFALPAGDADFGLETFISLQCHQCHSVANDIQRQEASPTDIHFTLGGEVTRVRTYGDLVTSIINPSHHIDGKPDPTTTDAFGNSRMKIYNDVMTVQQLIDLTAYLQDSYQLVVPQHAHNYYP